MNPTESFDTKIDDILINLVTRNYHTEQDEYGNQVMIGVSDAVNEATESIQQAISWHIIGEDLDPGAISTRALYDARQAQNRLKQHQRTKLFGDKQ